MRSFRATDQGNAVRQALKDRAPFHLITNRNSRLDQRTPAIPQRPPRLILNDRRQMYMWQVKPAAAAKSKYDFREKLATIAQDEAWQPLRDGGCPLIKA